MLNKQKFEEDTKENIKDLAIANLKGIIECIPMGSLLTGNIEFLLKPSIDKRKDKWLSLIVDAINSLDEKIDNIVEMFNDQLFVTMIINTTQSAMKTHQQEKIGMYKNVLINSYLNNEIDEDKKLIFLNWLDKFTLTHLKVLSFFNNPSSFNNQTSTFMMGSISQAMSRVFNDYASDRPIYESIVKDLFNCGLISIDTNMLNTSMTSSGAFSSRTTRLGREFIDFIIDVNQ